MNRITLLQPYGEQPQVEPIDLLPPSIEMTWEVFRDTVLLIALSRTERKELSWIGAVDVRREGDAVVYVISDIRLTRQEGTWGRTRLTAAGIGEVAQEWIRKRGNGENPCRFWGHTHPSARVDPSHIDDRQMLALIREGGPPFFLRGIFGVDAPSTSAFPSAPYSHPQGSWIGSGPSPVPATQPPPASGPWGRADFTLYDYAKGVRIRHVPWTIADAERSAELAALIAKLTTPETAATTEREGAPTVAAPPPPDGTPSTPRTRTRDARAPRTTSGKRRVRT